MKNMKKNPKQNRESSLMRSPLILGLSIVLCIPVAYSHAKSSNIVKNESVQSILQGRTIKGQIIDENNEPLIGVSVIIKGASTIGTITDFDGNYALEVPAGKNVLEISYIRYFKTVFSCGYIQCIISVKVSDGSYSICAFYSDGYSN